MSDKRESVVVLEHDLALAQRAVAEMETRREERLKEIEELDRYIEKNKRTQGELAEAIRILTKAAA